MKALYTLEEVHRYADEIRKTNDDMWAAIKVHDAEANKQLQTQLHVMREVLLRMHESIEKHGPWRPGLIGRMFAAREIRKGIVEISGKPMQLDLSAVPKPKPKEAIK